MDRAAVIGAGGGSARKVAERLADALHLACYPAAVAAERRAGVCYAPVSEAIADAPLLLVYVEDAAPRKGGRDLEREAAFERLARAQANGSAVVILEDGEAARRWFRLLRDEGVPGGGPMLRVFVAAAPSPEAGELTAALERVLGLPVIRPDREDASGTEGWGRRFATAASRERWIVQSASWHAVEYLVPRASLVVHIPGEAEPSAQPERRTWRVLFGAWFKRYPKIEAHLLARELAAHSHEAPVYTVRNEHELSAVLAGFGPGR